MSSIGNSDLTWLNWIIPLFPYALIGTIIYCLIELLMSLRNRRNRKLNNEFKESKE